MTTVEIIRSVPGDRWGRRTVRTRGRHWRTLFAFLVLGCTAGCSVGVKPAPFNAYAESMRKVQVGADDSLLLAYTWSRESYLDRASEGGQGTGALQLERLPGDPLGWRTGDGRPVLPWKVAEFRSGLDSLNTAFVQYADLLARLASEELVSPAEFKQLADDLNVNVKSAVKALSGEEPNADQAALFSTAASEAARLYIENKRKKELVNALRDNQVGVERAAGEGSEAVRVISAVLWRAYGDQATALGRTIDSGSSTTTAERREATSALLALDEQLIGQLAILRALHASYQDLPKAHQELLASVEKPDPPLDQIRALYENGRRLQRLYDELRKKDGSGGKPDVKEEA